MTGAAMILLLAFGCQNKQETVSNVRRLPFS